MIICTNIRPYALPKITSPLPSGVSQSERKSSLRAGEGKREGRTGEGSDIRRQSSVWMTGSAPGHPDADYARAAGSHPPPR